jgi:phenylalanyl-tRNA synthetase beta subunit
VKKNQLNMEQMFEVGRYLVTIEERLKTEGPAYATVAEWAQKQLGFTVSEGNVETAARCSKVTWEIKQARRSPKLIVALKGRVGNLEFKVSEVETALKEVRADNAYLRGLLHNLYTELGVKPPQGVTIPRG